MRKAVPIFLFFILFITLTPTSQAARPKSAKTILSKAVNDGRSSKKNVFLLFGASWCSWCKRLEKALEQPAIKKVFKRNYIMARLNVNERGKKIKTHENPGSQQILAGFEGKDAGLPFYVILNAKGQMIANSNAMPGNQNIGYPGSKEEIEAFMTLLKQTAPRMTAKQRTMIANYLKKNAPKP